MIENNSQEYFEKKQYIKVSNFLNKDVIQSIVKTENISVSAGKNTETLNISELNQGTYNLKITHSGSVEIRNAKIVKN
jgi:hypothetical protein